MKTRFILFSRILLTILCLFILALILRGVAKPAQDGLTLFQEKDKIVYKIELTVDAKERQLCALLYNNNDIQEVYNILIENSDRFPIHPQSYKVDDGGNVKACFRLSVVADNFSLFVIKFDKEALAVDIGFSNINLALIPGIKDF